MASPRALTSWLAPLTNSRRRRRRPAPGSRLGLESLECRVVPATLLPPPDPIDPTKGQTNLLRVVQMMADKQNLNAQDHFPVPYTIIVSAGGAAPTIKNWHAGTAIQLDADQNKATGQGGGGNDIQVEVNTDFYTNALGQPDWKLRLNVNRLGKDSFAQNLSVMIAFPFDAFNTETLPAKPNLLMGFQTRLPGTPGQADYTTGADGGNAPATMQMVLTPHILAGTTHAFEWSIDTTGATNPLTFLSGEFDGNPGSNTILNALGWSAYVQDVPAHIGAELKVAENAIGSPAVDSKMDLHWTASAPSLTTFDYLEAESKAAASSPQTADYATQIVADKMPTDEHFVLRQDEAGGVMTLNHDANAPIHEMTFLKRRSDGLALTGVASDENPAADAVPTHVALTLGLRGYETLDVNDNTLDLFLQDTQVGGFNNTSQFFQKYNLEYVALKVKNAPDQSANFDGAGTTFTMLVTNAGEVAPFTEMVLDDNGRISATNAPQNLELPDKYDVTPLWDLWSIVDDGTHGTAVARALDVTRLPASPKFTGSATFDHEPTEIVETVELQTVAAHPMQTYLKSGLLSAVQPPIPASAISPDPYVEITGHIEDVPTDHTRVTLDFPLDADWDTDHKIGEICMAGHIGSLNFATILEDNPTHGSFKFRPEGSLVVTALDQSNNPDFFSGNAAIVYDVNGFDPNVVHWPEDYSLNGFHSKHETFFPNDTRLKEARLRLDHVPSMRATWDDEPQHTYIDIDTDATSGPFAYVGGIQLQISTKTTLGGTVLTCDNVKDFLPPAATPQSQHYALLKDVAGEQTLKFGVFGVDSFHFASDDTSKPSKYSVDWALDPARPATASRIDVDAHPTSTGALGTFFGGSEVTGPLLISAVPADMHVKSDFDPSFSTATLFPFGLPVPLEINQPMTVDGTDIFVHAVQVPQIFSVTWNTAGPTTNLSVVATDKFGNPAAAKVVDVIFRNPNGLPDGSDLFQDAANPLRRFDVQVDNVPSLKASLTTTGNPHVNIDTTATAGPFQYLGGLRMAASTNAGPPLPAPPIIPPIPPTYPAPTPADHPYLRLRDVGANKSIEVGAFGLDNIDVLVNNAASTATITYNADAARPFTAMVHSVNGRFFSTHTVDAGLVVNALPQSETLTIAANGQSLTSTAGAQGQISSIQLGGTDLVDPTFNPSTQPSATYDNVLIDVAAQNLPNIFGYSFNPAGSVSLTADNTPAALPDRIGGVTAYIRSQSGIPGTAGILGSPLKDARLRLDDVPSLSGTWSTGGGNTSFALDTTGTNVFLGGAQVGLSTLFGDVAPLSAPTPGQGQTFTALDRTLPGLGPVARLSAGLFGLEHVSLTYTKSPAQLTTHYQADVARRLDVSFNTRAGSALSGGSHAVATVAVDKLPTAWDLDTDLKKHFKHHSSGPIQSIDVDATIDDTQDGVTNPDHVVVHVRGLPTDLEVMMGQEADTTDDTAHTKTHTKTTFAHASGTVGSISFEETRDLPSAGHRPSWVFAQITGLPGNVDMVDKTVTDLTDKDNPKDTTTTDVTVTNPDNTPGTLPFVRIVTSVDSKATTLANDLALFTNIPSTPGGLVKRDGFEQTIDNRYYPGSVRDRLNDLYGTSPGLDSTGGQLEDHYLTRKYGERTIPGVTVTLSGDASQTTTTDANGNYSFAGLSPGKYTITETQPAGVTEGLVNGPGDLGGDASANTFANITVGTTQDGNGKTVTQSGHGYNFGERSLPNPGLAAGPGAADPNAPGTLSGSVFLDENNDGVYQAKDLVDYTDIQMSNFQSLHTLKAPGGVQKADLSVPGNPPHPFFFGSADRDSLTFAKIENLPSTVHLDVIKKEHVYLDTNTSAGRVDFYMGPIGGAGHGDEAIRATLTGAPTAGGVFVNTPTSVHLDYKDVGKFPGGASFQASGPFELRLLYQTTDKRVVGDLQMEDATLSYGIQGPTFASDVVHVSDIFNFLPGPIKDLLTLPLKLDDPSIATALGLFKVFAKLDTVGDVSGQGASGFFSLYDLYNNPEPLDGGGPAPGSSEFVPRLTASVRNFQGVDTSFELELEPKPWEQNIPGIPFELDFTPPTPHFGPGGGFTLDFWDTGLFDIKIPPIEALGVTIFPELDFKDPPDYATGNPWHIVPFLFSGGPIDPFPPQLADGVGPGAAPADVITAVPDAIVQEAVSRWQAAGQHPESLGPIKFAVADLPGSFLGTVTGNTVWIDRDAAGHGWFVDPTPRDDAEFPAAAGTAAAGRMDLLTVVSHEIGRLLGLDVPDAGQYPVMSLTLAPGTRLGDGAAAAGGVVAAADNLVVTDTTARPLPAAMTFGAGVTAGPGFTSPAAFAPELGGVALADADGEAETSQTPVVALFDPEKQWTAAALGGDLPLDTATRSGSGGMLAAYTQRPADPMTEDEFAPLWVG